MNTRWDCGSPEAVSQWRWAASQHILSPAQDSIWWLLRCNWSVDYYLSCACQIKIIKMQRGSDGKWMRACRRLCYRGVLHIFSPLELERNPTILLGRTLCYLQKMLCKLHLKLHSGWMVDSLGHGCLSNIVGGDMKITHTQKKVKKNW